MLPITNGLRAEHLTREGSTKLLAGLLLLSPVPRGSFGHDALRSATVYAEPPRYIADVQTASSMYPVDMLRPDSISAEWQIRNTRLCSSPQHLLRRHGRSIDAPMTRGAECDNVHALMKLGGQTDGPTHDLHHRCRGGCRTDRRLLARLVPRLGATRSYHGTRPNGSTYGNNTCTRRGARGTRHARSAGCASAITAY